MSFKSVLRRSSRRSTQPWLTVWPLEGTWLRRGWLLGGWVVQEHGGEVEGRRGIGTVGGVLSEPEGRALSGFGSLSRRGRGCWDTGTTWDWDYWDCRLPSVTLLALYFQFDRARGSSRSTSDRRPARARHRRPRFCSRDGCCPVLCRVGYLPRRRRRVHA